MKLKLKAENPLEWIALKLNLAPVPLFDTQITFIAARSIMTAAELGIYEYIGKGSKTAIEIAKACNTHLQSTEKLLGSLVGIGYLSYADKKYQLPRKFHKWLLKENESNIISKLRCQFMEWEMTSKLEQYVLTGQPVNFHSISSKDQWELYQEAMRDLSVNASKELGGKIPVLKGATEMLDIGGSHGLYSIELCKKNPGLSSVILELSEAIESASAIGKRYDKSGILNYMAGNILTDDIGEAKYGLIIINNLVHHFTFEQNKEIAKKIAKALKPGGFCAIGDIIRSKTPGEGGIAGATMDLYFSLISASGTWSVEDIKSWQQAAGLTHEKTISAMTIPGWKMIIAKK
ncbi:hypothetical protein BH23BAC2_BH23BAC2_18300 [soil metagenome]